MRSAAQIAAMLSFAAALGACAGSGHQRVFAGALIRFHLNLNKARVCAAGCEQHEETGKSYQEHVFLHRT